MIASKHVPGTAVTVSLHKNTAKTAAGSDAFSGKHLWSNHWEQVLDTQMNTPTTREQSELQG